MHENDGSETVQAAGPCWFERPVAIGKIGTISPFRTSGSRRPANGSCWRMATCPVEGGRASAMQRSMCSKG
jgi:hypothetical protein